MVEFITYKEKQYPVRIGYFALKMLKKEKGIDLEEVGVTGDLTIYEPMLYYGLISGAKAMDQKCDFKEEQMEDILDECLFEFIEVFQKFFPDKTTKTFSEKKTDLPRRERRKLDKHPAK